MVRIPAIPTFIVLLLAAPMSCAPVRVSLPALVLDGPALHIAGVYSGMSLEGVMDRGCMAGVGTMSLRAVGVADADKAEAAAEQSKAEDTAIPGKTATAEGKTKHGGTAVDTEKTDKTAAKGNAAGTGEHGGTNAGGKATAAVPGGKAEAKGKVSTSGEWSTGHGADETGNAGDTPAPAFSCSAKLDVLPDRKGRVNGVLECTSGRRMAFSLRNLGPDQGLGIARESREGALMVFFYHAAESEARRRLPQILAEIESVRSGAQR
ncbi:MAG: hypothetical protein LBP38_08565 [Desulfovibrio sp.]|nr:hypothetical protein [Desulfovibrio sp.]